MNATEDVAGKVLAIIAEQALLAPEDVGPDMTLSELGIDSVAIVESLFALEEAFDITIPFNPNDPAASDVDVSTVRSIIEAVEGLVRRDA